MKIDKNTLIIAAAVALGLYLVFIAPKRGIKNEGLTAQREVELAQGDTATITDAEARNLCRGVKEGLNYWNVWGSLGGGSNLYAPLVAMWDKIKSNRANAIKVLQAWRTLNLLPDYPNLPDALAAEYLLWGSSTSALRTEVVNYLLTFGA
jgi:hypothetical protein